MDDGSYKQQWFKGHSFEIEKVIAKKEVKLPGTDSDWTQLKIITQANVELYKKKKKKGQISNYTL